MTTEVLLLVLTECLPQIGVYRLELALHPLWTLCHLHPLETAHLTPVIAGLHHHLIVILPHPIPICVALDPPFLDLPILLYVALHSGQQSMKIYGRVRDLALVHYLVLCFGDFL